MSINSEEELFHFLLPVLRMKIEKENSSFSERDLFNALKNYKWKKAYNLHLCDIVEDILNCGDENETK